MHMSIHMHAYTCLCPCPHTCLDAGGQGKTIANNLDFEEQIKHYTPGDTLRFDLVNENDVARTVTVELGGAGIPPV